MTARRSNAVVPGVRMTGYVSRAVFAALDDFTTAGNVDELYFSGQPIRSYLHAGGSKW
jgi:hypothetical protein